MPHGVHACLPCANGLVAKYMRDRFALGASLATVSAELAAPRRRAELGYKRPPGPAMLATHIEKHMAPVALPSRNRPDFTSLPAAQRPLEAYVEKDVAMAIREQALEQLAKGEMRLTAAHALRAQEMLDRRVEKQKDREMHVLLARVLTRHQAPPPKYVGPAEDIIEGVAEVLP
jgi:hypothetical protein